MTTKPEQDTKTPFPNSSGTQAEICTKTEDSHRKICLAKAENGHESSLKPSATFGTFKRDPADRDASKLSQACTSGESEGSDSEVVEVLATKNDYQLPRTQSRYMAEIGDEAEPLIEGSLDAPSTPIPELPNHGLTMDVSNDLTQQSVDDMPGNIDTVHPLIKPEPLDDEVNLRPAKRPRCFLEAVEVPTLASILKRENSVVPTVSQGKYDESIGKFINPKVKRKKDYVLSVDTVRERMRGIPEQPYNIPLDQGRASVAVTRQFLSTVYGGNCQMTFPKIAVEKLATHGLNDFMYPNLDMNPYAPEVPGARGLFFAPRASDRPAEEWPEVQRVITRIASAEWQYVGQYRMRPAASLTKEEWASQSDKVRNTWVKEMCNRDWGQDARARIYLRKTLGRDFTKVELDEEYRAERNYDISLEDADRALMRGEECIAVWTMECIDYDVDFQLNLAEKFPSFVPPPPKKKKAAGTQRTKKATVKKESTVKTGNKRKRSAIESSNEDGDEDSDFELEGLAYTPRGTRSRPHNIL